MHFCLYFQSSTNSHWMSPCSIEVYVEQPPLELYMGVNGDVTTLSKALYTSYWGIGLLLSATVYYRISFPRCFSTVYTVNMLCTMKFMNGFFWQNMRISRKDGWINTSTATLSFPLLWTAATRAKLRRPTAASTVNALIKGNRRLGDYHFSFYSSSFQRL